MTTTHEPLSPALRVGLIGVGTMGRPMAQNILQAGLNLSVWARRPEAVTDLAGATIQSSPAAVARESDVLITMLRDLPDVRALLDGPEGLLAGMEHPLVLVICSTSSPEGVRVLARELDDATGGLCRVVDAPVSGGEAGAIAGRLAIMMGGDEADVERARPALEPCGTPVHLGPLGAGEVAKACNQIIVAATVVGLGEAVVLAERSGVDVAAMLDLLQGGLAHSRVLEQKRDKFVNRDHSPTGAARYMVKDLAFVLDQAEKTHTTLRLASRLDEIFTDLVARGLGDEDTSVVQTYIEELG